MKKYLHKKTPSNIFFILISLNEPTNEMNEIQRDVVIKIFVGRNLAELIIRLFRNVLFYRVSRSFFSDVLAPFADITKQAGKK